MSNDPIPIPWSKVRQEIAEHRARADRYRTALIEVALCLQSKFPSDRGWRKAQHILDDVLIPKKDTHE